jgi:methionyl aminopeptidase
MIYYKTDDEIELIRQSSIVVSKVLGYIGSILEPGKTGLEIDKLAEIFIKDHNGVPAFKGYRGFPGTLCISINDSVVHGIPNNYSFRDSDLISIDCGVVMNGYYGDSAYTFLFTDVSNNVIELCKVTNASLYKGIEEATIGKRIGDIGFAIQNHCEKPHGYGIVRELVGHGIGRNLHEDPEVPNFGMKGKGVKLLDGMTIAIEPMVNLGTKSVIQENDGWTIKTRDGKPSAHYEHTIAIRKGKADILTDHSFISNSVKNNSNLVDIS